MNRSEVTSIDQHQSVDRQRCHICTAWQSYFGETQFLGRRRVGFFQCEECGVVQTEAPTWLEEAYSSPIAALDIGLAGRCIWAANIVETLLRSSRLPGPYLDWAGGYGLLTRLLRDRGIDFQHHDPYTENLFAPFNLADPTAGRWGLVTMFEVWEHLAEPVDELSNIVAKADLVLFTTEVLPEATPQPANWWYYTPDTGQHVTFYSLGALRKVADKLDMHLLTDGRRLHLLHRERRLPWTTRAMFTKLSRLTPQAAWVLRKSQRASSLVSRDFDERLALIKNRQEASGG